MSVWKCCKHALLGLVLLAAAPLFQRIDRWERAIAASGRIAPLAKTGGSTRPAPLADIPDGHASVLGGQFVLSRASHRTRAVQAVDETVRVPGCAALAPSRWPWSCRPPQPSSTALARTSAGDGATDLRVDLAR